MPFGNCVGLSFDPERIHVFGGDGRVMYLLCWALKSEKGVALVRFQQGIELRIELAKNWQCCSTCV